MRRVPLRSIALYKRHADDNSIVADGLRWLTRDMLKLLMQHRLKLAAAALFFVVLAVVGIVLWGEQFDLQEVLRQKQELEKWLEGAHPGILLVALAVLPLLGFPVSALLLIAGVTYGEVTGMVVSMLGLMLNNTLGYAIAAKLRAPVQTWVEKKGVKVPVVPPRDYTKIVLLFRITPGLPLCFQNYLLGLARIPFLTYFWVSIPPQLVVVAGFVLTGGALFEGKRGGILLGLSLILVFGIVGRIIHTQAKKKQNDATDSAHTSR